MFFQNPNLPDVYPEGYYFSIDFPLWIAFITLAIFSGIVFFARSRASQIKTQKAFLGAIGYLLFFIGITWLIYIIAIRSTSVDYDFMTEIGYLAELIGMTGFIFKVERYIFRKTKFTLTIFSFIGIVLTILSMFSGFSRDIARLGTTIISTTDIVIIIIMFLILIFKTTGSVRKRTIISFIGIVTAFIGCLLDSELFYGLWPTMPVFLPPILGIIGLAIVVINHRLEKLK